MSSYMSPIKEKSLIFMSVCLCVCCVVGLLCALMSSALALT